MWGRLSSLGQNITELTKDLAKFEDSSDEEEEDDDFHSDRHRFNNTDNSRHHHHHHHDDQDITQYDDDDDDSLREHQKQPYKTVYASGDDGADVSIESLREQLAQSERQNVLITQEYRRLLKEKEEEMGQWKKDQEMQQKEAHDRLQLEKSRYGEMVAEQQRREYSARESEYRHQIEDFKRALDEKDQMASSLEGQIRRLRQQQVEWQKRRERAVIDTEKIDTPETVSTSDDPSDEHVQIQHLLAQLRQEIVELSVPRNQVDQEQSERSTTVSLEEQHEENMSEETAELTDREQQEDSSPAGDNETGDIEAGSDNVLPGALTEMKAEEIPATIGSMLKILDTLDQHISNVMKEKDSESRKTPEEPLEEREDIVNSLQDFRHLLLETSASLSSASTESSNNGDKHENESDDVDILQGMNIMELIFDLSNRFNALHRMYQTKMTEQHKQIRACDRRVEELEEKISTSSTSIHQLLVKFSDETDIGRIELNSQSSDLATLVSIVKQQFELKDKYFRTCRHMIQSIDSVLQNENRQQEQQQQQQYQIVDMDEETITYFETLLEHLQTISSDSHQLHSQLKELEQRNVILQEEFARLEQLKKQEVQHIESRLQEVMNESRTSANVQHQQYQNVLTQSNSRIEELEREIQRRDYATREMEIDEQQLQILNEHVIELKNKNEYLSELLESTRHEHAISYAKLEQIIVNLKDELEDHTSREIALRQTIGSLSKDSKKIKELEDSLASLESVLEQFNRDYETDVKKLTDKLNDAHTRLQKREDEIEEANNLIEKYKRQQQQQEQTEREEPKIITPGSSATPASPSLIASPRVSISSSALLFDGDDTPDFVTLQQQLTYLHKCVIDAIGRINDENLVDRRLVCRLLLAYYEQGIGAEADRSTSKIFEVLTRTLRMKDHEAKELRDAIKQHDTLLVSETRRSSSWFSSSPSRRTSAKPLHSSRIHRGQTLGELWIQFLLEKSEADT